MPKGRFPEKNPFVSPPLQHFYAECLLFLMVKIVCSRSMYCSPAKTHFKPMNGINFQNFINEF